MTLRNKPKKINCPPFLSTRKVSAFDTRGVRHIHFPSGWCTTTTLSFHMSFYFELVNTSTQHLHWFLSNLSPWHFKIEMYLVSLNIPATPSKVWTWGLLWLWGFVPFTSWWLYVTLVCVAFTSFPHATLASVYGSKPSHKGSPQHLGSIYLGYGKMK